MTKETRRVLKRAAELLEKPGSWTQGTLARGDKNLKPVSHRDRLATKFCLMGAVRRAAHEANGLQALDVHNASLHLLASLKSRPTATLPAPMRIDPTYKLLAWNDSKQRTHVDVQVLIHKALSTEETT